MEGLGLPPAPKAETRGEGAEKPKTAKEQAEDIVKKEEAKKTGLDRYDAEDWFRIAAAFGRAGQESTATGNILGDISQILSSPAGAFADAEARIKAAEKAKKAEEREERLTAASERRADIETELAQKASGREDVRLQEALRSGKLSEMMADRKMSLDEAVAQWNRLDAIRGRELQKRGVDLTERQFENQVKREAKEFGLKEDQYLLALDNLDISREELQLAKKAADLDPVHALRKD